MKKGFIFFSMLLLFVFMIQSSFALEIERKIYTPNNNIYEIPTIKQRKLFNITFNLSKPPIKIFNTYNPSRWEYYTDRNIKRNRETKNSQASKVGKAYEPKFKFNDFGKSKSSGEKIERKKKCSYGKHIICYKNKCFCIRNSPRPSKPLYPHIENI